MEDIIIIEGLVKKFGEKTAVNGLDLRIHQGELFGFLGPNGAGKTTTLRCVSTLTGFDEGTIIVDGNDIRKNPEAAKGSMGVIQQQVSLDKDLTIRENMISHAMYHNIGKKERNERIAELSDFFGRARARSAVPGPGDGRKERLSCAPCCITRKSSSLTNPLQDWTSTPAVFSGT